MGIDFNKKKAISLNATPKIKREYILFHRISYLLQQCVDLVCIMLSKRETRQWFLGRYSKQKPFI